MAAATADSTAVMGFSGFSGLNFLKQLGLMVGLAASVAIGFAVVLWSQESEYRPLFNSAENIDTNTAISVLEAELIDYRLDPLTGKILVDAEKIHTARLKLAASGVSGKADIGLDMLNQEQSLGTSQFIETARYRHGLEGELARTISSIHAVKNARVHLAIPKASVFVRAAKRPRASIFLELYSGRGLSSVQVKAIRNMVAFSIPELKIADVTVVDQQGNLLSSLENEKDFEVAGKQLAYVKRIEKNVNDRVTSILRPIIGVGGFLAEVTADVDFTQMEQTDEIFNPELPSVRSEEILEEEKILSGGGSAQGVPGALSNQPADDATIAAQQVGQGEAANAAQGAGAKPSTSRKHSTRNYEIDRTISHTRHQVGRLQRLSVAVVVDYRHSVNEEGVTSSTPWSTEEIANLTQLVKDTVGFDEARGDSVNVLNSPFIAQTALAEPEALSFWQQPWFFGLMKQVLAALFVLLLVFMVLKPTLKSLSTAAPPRDMLPTALDVAPSAAMTASANDSFGGTGQHMDHSAAANQSSESGLPALDGNFDQQMGSIKDLIQEDPNRVAQVIKKWVADSE